MAERTCIVTREVRDPAELIRFVAGPDGSVVPDLKRKLPGRGVWVSANRHHVDLAAKKSLFSRGLKCGTKANPDLGNAVDTLLANAALSALGFARKAGQCMTGSSKAENAIRSGDAIALLHATDAAEDGIRKLHQASRAAEALGAQKVESHRVFTIAQMSQALGAENVVHCALTSGSAAANCKRSVAALVRYRLTPEEDDKNEGKAKQAAL